jgi:SAM-dependent methyltransferase
MLLGMTNSVGNTGSSKTDPTEAFYDALAADYDLIYDNWQAAIEYSGDTMRALLEAQGVGLQSAVLDCCCGIGTQAIGLSSRGYNIVGTDISSRSIERARTEAKSRGLAIRFEVADLRMLSSQVKERFDAVISFDNALPHLLTEDELYRGLTEVRRCLLPGSPFLASVRDYDKLTVSNLEALNIDQRRNARPSGTLPRMIKGANSRRMVVQSWTWLDDEPIYDVDLFIVTEGSDRWVVRHSQGRYRAYLRSELTDAFKAAGLDSVRWLPPEESGYYQPVIIGRAPS